MIDSLKTVQVVRNGRRVDFAASGNFVARQRGATLATALFFLLILTLLGLAAVRSGNTGLHLSDNEFSRQNALQNAQTAVGYVTNSANSSTNLAVLPGSGYVQSCVIGSSLDSSKLSSQQGFTCASNTSSLLPSVSSIKPYLYISVYREQVNGYDFVPVSAVRQGDSGASYNLASFTVTAGYDRVATNDGTAPQGGAEIAQGVYVKVAKVRGLTQQ